MTENDYGWWYWISEAHDAYRRSRLQASFGALAASDWYATCLASAIGFASIPPRSSPR